jgi:hypothetical protein
MMEFCQRLETLQEFQPVQKDKSNNNKKTKTEKKNHSPKQEGSKYCLIHGKGTHDSNQCKVLKAQVQGEQGAGNKNKTWTRKSDDYKKKQSKELAASSRNQFRRN